MPALTGFLHILGQIAAPSSRLSICMYVSTRASPCLPGCSRRKYRIPSSSQMVLEFDLDPRPIL